MIKDTQDPYKPNIVDLKQFKFRKRRGRPKKFPDELKITIEWYEYDYQGDAVVRSLAYEAENPWHDLKYDGKKQFIEKCFHVIGHMYDTDPSLARELEERLGELYDSNRLKDNE